MLGLGSIAAVTMLEIRADASRTAGLELEHLNTEVNVLQGMPWRGAPRDGTSRARARASMREAEQQIEMTLTSLARDGDVTSLEQIQTPLTANLATLRRIQRLVERAQPEQASKLVPISARSQARAERAIRVENRRSDEQATQALREATVGSAVVILMLLFAFAFFFNRSVRARRHAQAELGERIRAEDAVRHSEEQYRLLFESNPSPMWVFDARTFRFLAVNEAAVRNYGYSRAEFLEMTLEDIRPAEDVPRLRTGLEELLSVEDGTSHGGLWRHRRRDGSLIDVEITAESATFEGRKAVVVLAFDATSRLQAQNELRNSERRYRELIENATDMIATVDLDERFTSVNAAFERALGYSEAELIGRRLGEFVPSGSVADLDSALQEKLAGHVEATTYEHELIGKDGRRVIVEAASRLIVEDGRPVGVQAICRDITERHDAEEALRESRELYRLLVETSTDVIALLDRKGRILYASPSHRHTLGYEPDRLTGADALDFIHPDDHATVTGDGDAPRIRLVHADGRFISVEWTKTPIQDQDGKLRMILATGRDVSEALRAEELEGRLRQAEKLEAVGSLAGGIAHDFNNLLTAIIGYGDIALADLSDREDGGPRECVQEMMLAGNRAAELTGQLLAFSRKQVLQPRVLHLNDVVEEYEPMLTRLLGDNVVVRFALDPELAAVKADAGQVGQVVLNLAVNARDAMVNGGELTIATRNVELEETTAPITLQTGAYVVLSVTDTGTGIDAETCERIFEPFFTTKKQGEGTGLGLATVHGIVQQSGGQITVYSEPGHGTTFNVYLPQTEEPRRGAGVIQDVAPRRGTERVLLVEDNEAVRGLVHQMCESLGYELLTAASPSEAIALCDSFEGTIDLLLTDVMMPEMNGRELADELLARRPRLRVLFTSGFTGDAITVRGVLDAEAAFLQKPFTRKQLARSAREILDAA